MADKPADVAALVLQQVAVLLGELKSADVRDLARGHKRLGLVNSVESQADDATRLVRPGASRTSQGRSAPDPDEVRASLMAMSTRDEATRYIETLGSVAELRALAERFGVRLASQERKAAIARKIVDGTLGLELTAQAVRGASSR